jgi:hypothetical protein
MGEPLLAQPGHILEALPEQNVPRPGGGGNWTEKIAGGQWLLGPNPRHAWISVHDPQNEFDQPLTGLSGTIVSKPEVSTADVQFVHPFGNDFEFHVAPDPPYFDLVAPNMEDSSYASATNTANAELNLNVPGVIGMEMDGDLVPDEYKPKVGDRVALWGRLIVDAGHVDFHTEIHPPLVMVSAQQGRSSGQKPESTAFDATSVRITSRPFLVSQEFDHGSLFNQLSIQVGEAALNPFSRIDAHPRLMPKPFAGRNIITFDIRPPSPRRRPGDRLILESTITQRSAGVTLTAMRHQNSPDAVRVSILLNDDDYTPPAEPPRHDFDVSLAELLLDKVGKAGFGVIFGGVAGIPNVGIVVARGFPTHRYEKPNASSAGHANSKTRRQVEDDAPNIPTNRDDGQPFPLFGTMTLEWERAPEWLEPVLHMMMT